MPARVVVVHDDPTLREPLVASLRAGGHDVAAFNDSTQAWDALTAAGSVEILITRVNFGPDKPHGIALARSARERRPGIRILFVGRSEFQADAEGLGSFLPLPVTVPEVAETVGRMLSSDRLGRGAAPNTAPD